MINRGQDERNNREKIGSQKYEGNIYITVWGLEWANLKLLRFSHPKGELENQSGPSSIPTL